MLNWLFKKRRTAESTRAPAAPPAPPVPAPETPEQRRAAWQARLAAAQHDDAALLAIAREAPLLEVMLGAVEALRDEETLKAAEREFRRHDRRVHQRVRQRLDAVVTRRESRAKAAALIDVARTLAAEPVLPLNRLVQIDREWQALDAASIEPAQADAFAAARAALDTLLREQEAQRQRERERKAQPAPAAEPEAAPASPAAAVDAAAVEPPASAAPAPTATSSPERPPPSPRARPRAATREQTESIERLIAAAEAAAAEGLLAPLSACMSDLERALDALGGAALPTALRERRQAVTAEFARLRGWQQWGSARAVDMLVEAAEALAQAVAAPDDAQTAEAPAAARPPLVLDAHAAAIRDLRARWKALAQQQAAAAGAQWKRFDAALQAAYAPLAERQAVLDAQRRDNLAARTVLLDALDARAAEAAEGAPAAEHWRAQARALDQFRAEWRTLGPLEHRVPREARQAIRERLRRSLERLEAPLARARSAAAAAREPLVAAAEALAQDESMPLREASARARELQAEWARCSRELPLAHAAEQALWQRFRAAVDALYARRNAAMQAVDAEREALLAERESLIARLDAVDPASPAAELVRLLAEIDDAWRQAPEPPRGTWPALVQRYAQARTAVQARIDDEAQRRWQSQCDTLAARLELCERREARAADEDESALGAQWQALGALPPDWDAALDRRWQAGTLAAPDGAVIDDALLRLEASLDLPSPPDLAPTRRALKLTTLKDTLEGRAVATPEPVQRAAWLLGLIGQPCADAAQRERLRAIVHALRSMPAAALPLRRESR